MTDPLDHDRDTVRRLLEHDLIEWADDTDLRLVWADLLQIDGDPLGRLVVLDHAGEAGGPAGARARAEAARLRERLAPRLWNHTKARAPAGVTYHWQLGFVRELEIEAPKLAETPATSRWDRARPGGVRTLETLLPQLLGLPALRFIESIRVRIPDHHATAWSGFVTNPRVTSATLREVHVGDPPATRARPSGQWEPGGPGYSPRYGDAISSFRRLRTVSVGGEMMRLPCREGSSQTRTHHMRKLATRPLTSPNRAALARGLWDASVNVHQAAFATARSLGPQAAFLLEDLIWFLRAPIGKKDPRPVEALEVLAAIGPASAGLLPEVLGNAGVLTPFARRSEALMRWLAALGPRARPAQALVDAVLKQAAGQQGAADLRKAAKRARKAILADRSG